MDEYVLSHFRIISRYEDDHKFQYRLESIFLPTTCQNCKCKNKLHKHGRRIIKCFDLPSDSKQVELHISHKRSKCLNCNTTFSEDLSHTIHEQHRCTKRLISYVEIECIDKTFVEVAKEVGLTEKTIRNISADFSEKLKKSMSFSPSDWMGFFKVDMIHPRCAVTDIKNLKLLEILHDCNKETIVQFVENLQELKNKLKFVSTDIMDPVREAVYFSLPHAKIFVDSILLEQYTRNFDEYGQLDIFMVDSLQYTQMFLEILHEQPSLDFEKKYLYWKSQLNDDLIQEFSPLLKIIDNWKREIFTQFDVQQLILHREFLDSLYKNIEALNRTHSFKAQRTAILYKYNQ